MTFRSEKFRRLVCELECVACGQEGMTQAAHAALLELGHGRSIKATDGALMALCVACHKRLDQSGSFTKSERRAVMYEWVTRTYIALMDRGMLVPNTSRVR